MNEVIKKDDSEAKEAKVWDRQALNVALHAVDAEPVLQPSAANGQHERQLVDEGTTPDWGYSKPRESFRLDSLHLQELRDLDASGQWAGKGRAGGR